MTPEALEAAGGLASDRTLRDEFALQAMQMKFGAPGSSMTKDRMAAECYEMADAMLAERAK